MTDPVYEGKSMQGMVDKVRRGEFPAGSRVLYAHLGVPAINAYSSTATAEPGGYGALGWPCGDLR